MSAQVNNKATFVRASFAVSRKKYDDFSKRVPRYGDKSKVLNRLLDLYLEGKVIVVIPGRQI